MAEFSFVFSFLSDSENEFWIGLTLNRTKQMFEWLDGWPMSFQNFDAANRANVPLHNHRKNAEHLQRNSRKDLCYSMSPKSGKWHSKECHEKLPFVCELPASEHEKDLLNSQEKTNSQICQIPAWIDIGTQFCYFVERIDKQTFQGALNVCQSVNGSLASIHDELEQTLIHQQLLDSHDIWIGLQRNDTLGYEHFQWVDGSSVNFKSWAPGEPSDPAEKCVEMYGSSGHWNDNNCFHYKGYVCKISKPAVK
ncbi:unnamed protein product [Notodromas monacha]|uniref:C-type lectin domain-containing protein n=1 Tax=Notodromas monacha TaxID=399045 RepID=A0A7R9BW67_9CRUS|nr:unnamed protein product [Notodromas monacha]CAG0921539.1 unnamed protein product [Notodromas monacha]